MRSSKHTACSENGHGRSHAAPPRIRRVAGRAGLGPAPTWTSTIRHSRFTIHHSPFAIRHSPFFSIRHSLFAIRGFSPLAARCSLRAVGVHKRRLADTSADCRGTACRAPTPCLPTGPCTRAAGLFAAGDGLRARCRRHNTTRAGLGPAPTDSHRSAFAIAVVQPARAKPRCLPMISAGYSVRVWNRLRQPRHVAAGRVENPPLPGSHHSQFAIRHSLFFAIRHSPSLTTRHSPLATRCLSPFAIRYSLFAIRCLSPLAARPIEWQLFLCSGLLW
jgi:hypothetical protein